MTTLKKGDSQEPVAEKTVRVRVIKKGDGRVHDGQGGKYVKGDEFEASAEAAAALEDAGLVDTL